MLIGLVFLAVSAIYYYSMRILLVLATTVIMSVFADFICTIARKSKYYLNDASAIYSGLVLGLLMPNTIPLYMAAVVSVVSIVVGKQCFGGKGNTIFNPIAVGYVFGYISYKTEMLSFSPNSMSIHKALSLGIASEMSVFDIIIGKSVGGIGTTVIFILIICAAYFMIKKDLSYKLFASFLVVYSALAIAFPISGIHSAKGFFCDIFSDSILFAVVFVAGCPFHKPCKSEALYGLVLAVFTIVLSRLTLKENTIMSSILISDVLADSIARTIEKLYNKVYTYSNVSYSPKGVS